MTRGERLEGAARGYLGTPWVRLGRSHAGLDCVGLPVLAAQDCGFAAPRRVRPYGDVPDGQRLVGELARYLEPVPGWRDQASWRRGDVAALALRRMPMHVGILGRDGRGWWTVLHTWQSVGRVVEHRLPPAWHDGGAEDCLRGLYRLRED